jgi:hypothetical protein
MNKNFSPHLPLPNQTWSNMLLIETEKQNNLQKVFSIISHEKIHKSSLTTKNWGDKISHRCDCWVWVQMPGPTSACSDSMFDMGEFPWLYASYGQG